MDEQSTIPLEVIAMGTAIAFSTYLVHHHLDSLAICIASGVRYSTVWNIQHGVPVTREHAAQVRRGVQQMTGRAYTGPINVLAD